ncbi:TonB-dependent receptor [Methylobacillus arboreus]|uniref:TonB-dependent siderophore receptor n=1 Tax=Methylobacillus arboreus TaxID=755170 RepID=UPI001E4A47D1|nr:TonB-dependent receptor [Methylobacillus arboreus]MCB5190988.1 TonB-dependent receptor [Methylobacillus arboreus]
MFQLQHPYRQTLLAGFKPTLTSILLAASLQAQATPMELDIPSQPLDKALNALARQSGERIVFSTDLTEKTTAPALKGRYEARQALEKLLEGSGLTLQETGNHSFTVIKTKLHNDGSLPEVTVKASAVKDLTTERTRSYAASSASLMKGAQSLKDIPQSVTVMTRQQMDDQRLDTLTSALANTPGIYFWKRPNGGNDIYSRGFMTDTIQYDGVPLRRWNSWGNDLSASSVFLDRIEVLRGSQGLLQGPGSPAGTVNLVRKRGLVEKALMIEGRAGSWDNYGARLDAGGPLNEEGSLRGRFVLDYEDKNSFIDYIWDRNLNAYAAIDFDLSPNTTVGFGVSHSHLNGNSALYQGLPRYTDGRSIDVPRSANIGAAWNESTRRETQVFLDVEHQFNERWKLKAAAVYVDDSFDALLSSANGRVAIGATTVPGIDYDYAFSSTSQGIDINIDGSFKALGIEHDLVFGGNYSKNTRDDGFHQSFGARTFDIVNRNSNVPGFGTYPITLIADDVRANLATKGVYTALRSHLTERLTSVIGGRVSWYNHEAKGIYTNLNSAWNTTMHETGEVTPHAGLVYKVTPEWSTYASYSEIFNPQNETDAQLNVLPPMTGKAYEVGVKGELFGGALNTSLAIFRVDQENRAVSDLTGPMVCGSSGAGVCSRAAGKVRTEGYEIEVHGELASGLQLSGGYTFNRNEYLQDNDQALIGKSFDYLMPRHMLRLWSNYQLPGEYDKWRIGLGVNYRSEQKTSSTTMVNPVQGGYAIWSARVGYEINEHWSAAMNVDNMFDKHYYSFISDNYYYSYVGEPRKVLFTLRWNY